MRQQHTNLGASDRHRANTGACMEQRHAGKHELQRRSELPHGEQALRAGVGLQHVSAADMRIRAYAAAATAAAAIPAAAAAARLLGC